MRKKKTERRDATALQGTDRYSLFMKATDDAFHLGVHAAACNVVSGRAWVDRVDTWDRSFDKRFDAEVQILMNKVYDLLEIE